LVARHLGAATRTGRRTRGYQRIIHEFVMLDALRETKAADAAMAQAVAFLAEAVA
jgi:hypothetical protein